MIGPWWTTNKLNDFFYLATFICTCLFECFAEITVYLCCMLLTKSSHCNEFLYIIVKSEYAYAVFLRYGNVLMRFGVNSKEDYEQQVSVSFDSKMHYFHFGTNVMSCAE